MSLKSPQMPNVSAKALMQRANEMTAVYFAASMLALLTALSIALWLDGVVWSHQSSVQSTFSKRVVYIARSKLIQKIPGFTSLGHAFIFVAYLAINFTLMFTDLNLTVPRNFAKRMGWITACNIALIAFLALKNTPLAFLTTYSYERLNVLHQTAGYCTVLCVIIHAIVYIAAWAQSHSLDGLLEKEQIMGIVAGFSMLIILATALWLRKANYEAFYITHITMYALILIGVGMHRPELATKTIFIIAVAAGIWFCDRLLRSARVIWYAVGNSATITPLERGGVRIALRRTPWRAVPGSHVFIWVPRIRMFESHPFTVVSTSPLELVVSARDGFTRDLLSYASANPGATLRASCDGPYGTLPNFKKFDHVVLIAGGSGASFTFGIAQSLLSQVESATVRPIITFIWVIRNQEMKTWFAKEITQLSCSPNVNFTIHVTQTSGIMTFNSDSSFEKDSKEDTMAQNLSIPNSDPEKEVSGGLSQSESDLSVVLGRPDVSARIREIVAAIGEHEKAIVAACGPNGLMKEIRDSVSDIVGSEQKSVALHCEQFGW